MYKYLQIPRPEPKKPRIQDYLDIPRYICKQFFFTLHKEILLILKINFFFENFSLAADGLLHKKANVATLKTWLGSQGIVVKSKSKKEELVLMVLTKLGTYLLH